MYPAFFNIVDLLQDSEENKGDYLTRMLRVNYHNVSSVYTLHWL